MVWQAYKKVKQNKGGSGVDGMTWAEISSDKEHEEPYEARVSRKVLWEGWGEIPQLDPIRCKRSGRHNRQKTNIKRTTKLPTLRKIKRAAMPTQADPNCSTFNFAQPHDNNFHIITLKKTKPSNYVNQ